MPNISGSIFYSAKFLRSNPLELKENLLQELYRYPAIPPENIRIPESTPDVPVQATIKRRIFKTRLTWRKGSNTKCFVIYRFRNGEQPDFSEPANIFRLTSSTVVTFRVSGNTHPSQYYYAVTALSDTNTESTGVFFKK